MKANLEFTLPDEAREHNDALNGTKYRKTIEKIQDVLDDDSYIDQVDSKLDEIRSLVKE